ncbi:hypothetical protein HANVADRAFT_51669 [Hanseniaspora valbyensis NRRL Y-1626]|uniref:BZIP domain-containing protein n=1 Tax=Hanseniaspora valbyensis NRRL Y-1626 TaxID=766949 RepID=A0A1B7TI02_9ASCO|nr:hypothetical protein HANVADRAFT_51669 [Hanseniaspora valbyensis NRRL Y-1626]
MDNNGNDANKILSKLRNLITINDDSSDATHTESSLKLHERDKLIDELKKLVDLSTKSNKKMIQKKKKKKKIKRQDLLKEILEDSQKSSSVAINNVGNAHLTSFNPIQHQSVTTTYNQNLNLNMYENDSLFDIDAHRFGANLYNDNLFQEFNLQGNQNESFYPTNMNSNFDDKVKPLVDNIQQNTTPNFETGKLMNAKEIYKINSVTLLKDYLNCYKLMDSNTDKEFEDFLNKKVDILRFARDNSLLIDNIPKPDPELLKILELPLDYNPYLIEGRPDNTVLVYNKQLKQFRIKHDLLSLEQKKELKKYRNRIASRRFRKVHSKSSQKQDEINNDFDSFYKTTITKLLPEIEELETQLALLLNENDNLNEKLKSKYKQKLTI